MSLRQSHKVRPPLTSSNQGQAIYYPLLRARSEDPCSCFHMKALLLPGKPTSIKGSTLTNERLSNGRVAVSASSFAPFQPVIVARRLKLPARRVSVCADGILAQLRRFRFLRKRCVIWGNRVHAVYPGCPEHAAYRPESGHVSDKKVVR